MVKFLDPHSLAGEGYAEVDLLVEEAKMSQLVTTTVQS